PLSVDLKDIIYEKIQAGETDNEIIYFLKQRYGDFISYRPPVKPSTWLIWYGPFVLLLVGGFLIFRFVSARQSNVTGKVSVSTSSSSKDLIASWKDEIDNEAEKS
ncbi:MAG: cytochrome c-type biogenesis protein CcmH, partial [Gammaproteobacteria bacterium]|nr:cytochrome c-type biogenesis protein CcmH [Gammaproteobacteria bacterium]